MSGPKTVPMPLSVRSQRPTHRGSRYETRSLGSVTFSRIAWHPSERELLAALEDISTGAELLPDEGVRERERLPNVRLANGEDREHGGG